MDWFSTKAKDERETERLIAEARGLKAHSRFQSPEDNHAFIVDLLVEVCEESDLTLAAIVAEPLGQICLDLFNAEPFAFIPSSIPAVQETLEAGVKLRTRLRLVIKVLHNEPHYLKLWRTKLKIILVAIISELPVNALCDPYPDGTVAHESVLRPETPLHDFIDDLPVFLTKLLCTFSDEDVVDTPLFEAMRQQVDARLCLASGIPWEERHTSKRTPLFPWDKKTLPLPELVSLYTDDTTFADFFTLPVPIPIPPDIRFEHTHIIGGTGHGKTQLLQYLIMDDLELALTEKRSLVILDPDGTLIRTIARTDYFSSGQLADRAVFIDPTDVEHPVGLNLFDISHVDGTDARTRETIENNTIELFEYFFDALLGSELTNRQSTLFRYLGLLLMQIPGGNIHTLRELMEDGQPYRRYMGKLEGSARTFFETRFFDRSLNETKKQILSRLWGVLSNRSLDRVFSATRNTIKIDEALQDGKIIFIHTSKEFLGEEGSHIFARMLVALLGQALIRRAAIAPHKRTPTYIYIDEAEGVVDATLVRLLAQVRKYKGAITLAHQHLDQLPAGARAGILANTSIKLAGGTSAKDASALAPEFRVKPEMILGQRKDGDISCFALFAKNITPAAMTFSVPLGFAERWERLADDEYDDLLDASRARYGYVVDVEEVVESATEVSEPLSLEAETVPDPVPVPSVPVSSSVSLPICKEGGGGARHREIQMLVKELGEAVGFRASVEEVILDGEGRVDVILRRDDLVICVEVSVTTTKEHELLNVQKCLRFGAQQVWVVAGSDRHKTGLERFIGAKLTEAAQPTVSYLTVDQLETVLLGFATTVAEEERVVRGYRVRSNAGTRAGLTGAVIGRFLAED